MDGLKIGDKIIVTAIAVNSYKDEHKYWRVVTCKPVHKVAWYVGYSWKQEGDVVSYLPNHILARGYPYLTNIKTIKLMRVKFKENGNDYFAYRQHIIKLTSTEKGE